MSAGPQSSQTATEQGGPSDTAISPLFWDENARLNGVRNTELTINAPKFALERGRPGDTEIDWGQAPAPAVIPLLIDQFARVLLPYANADAMAHQEPNVRADIYFNMYHDGVRIPGVVIENQSSRPIAVGGLAVNSAGRYTRQLPVGSQAGDLITPVVAPGDIQIIQLRPSEVVGTLPVSPQVCVSLALWADGRTYIIEECIPSGAGLDVSLP